MDQFDSNSSQTGAGQSPLAAEPSIMVSGLLPTATESDLGILEAAMDSNQDETTKLTLNEVLRGVAVGDDGVYLTFESVAGDTVIVSLGSAGAESPVPIVTLQGVTETSLEQLLQDGGQAIA